MRGLLSRLVQWMIRRWDLDDGLSEVWCSNGDGFREGDVVGIWMDAHPDDMQYFQVRFVIRKDRFIMRRCPRYWKKRKNDNATVMFSRTFDQEF